jgi:short-subunit dehydrogenase
VEQAYKQLGHIDVAVNNAGYGLFGAIEEVSEQEARAQIETNLFGALWVTQAVLPIMRAQQSGHIIQISSIGGVWTVPTGGLYHASKWGLEGFSQTLAAEVKGLGITVTITEFSTTSAHRAQQLPAYDAARASLANFRTASAPGDPKAAAFALLRIVDAAEPPLRVFFGDAGLPMIKREYAERIGTWERWNDVSLEAQGNLAYR